MADATVPESAPLADAPVAASAAEPTAEPVVTATATAPPVAPAPDPAAGAAARAVVALVPVPGRWSALPARPLTVGELTDWGAAVDAAAALAAGAFTPGPGWPVVPAPAPAQEP